MAKKAVSKPSTKSKQSTAKKSSTASGKVQEKKSSNNGLEPDDEENEIVSKVSKGTSKKEESKSEGKPSTKDSGKVKKKPNRKTKVNADELGDPADTFESMKDIITTMEENVRKFVDEEVKSAGKRVRMGAQQIKKLAGKLRKEVMETIKSRKG